MTNEVMIKVSHLSKSFNGQKVLDDISFEVKKGELLVILGESGEGKSVLLQHLIGLMRPDEGHIEIEGVDITSLPEEDLIAVRRGIGYLFQQGALFDSMTIKENLAFPLQEHTNLKVEAIEQKVRETLALVGLKEVEDKYPVELSGGMRKRAALARAIILGSKILFCDEPTSGLDPIRSRDISNLIRDIVNRLSCTTVVTSHDITNSFRIADRLILLHEGRIVAQGSKEELEKATDPYVQDFLHS